MTKEFYRYYDDAKFQESVNKKEFQLQEIQDERVYQEPYQIMIGNWISKPTMYENVLLYHGLGTGKTCTSIVIAEGFKEWLLENDKKVQVIVKSENLERNYINQLMTMCTNNAYISPQDTDTLYNTTGQPRGSDIVQRINYEKREEIRRKTWSRIKKVYEFSTYKKFTNMVESGTITDFSNTVVIVDEAHNVTNNTIYIALLKTLQKSYNYKLVLLTATPMADNSKEILDISNLLNASNPELQFPSVKEMARSGMIESLKLDNPIIKGEIIKLTDAAMQTLESRLDGKVSYMSENIDTNPKLIHKGVMILDKIRIVECVMSNYQYSVYKTALAIDTGLTDTTTTTTTNVDEDKQNSLYKNSTDASTIVFPGNKFGKAGFTSSDAKRAFRNLPKYACKLDKMLGYLSNTGTHFIYSNFVTFGGTEAIKMALLQNGYREFQSIGDQTKPHFVILSSQMSTSKKDRFRSIFNSPQNKDGSIIKILIGSPLMAEGLTLRNVRNVHILEPFWNMTRIKQVIGRAARNHSHDNLDENERYVNVYKYAAVHPTPTSFYIDKEKYILSITKDVVIKNIERLLKRISFDCSIVKERNVKYMSKFKDGDAECDYEECDYACKIKQSGPSNTDTFDLYHDFFTRHSREFVKEKIISMFKLYIAHHIKDIIVYTMSDKKQVWDILKDMVESREKLTDEFNRQGFLINRYPYFIFNPIGKVINDSIFSKSLDFHTKQPNFAPIQKPKPAPTPQQSSPEQPIEQLTKEQIVYNNKLLDTNIIIGSWRKRGVKNKQLYGPTDDIFRIIYQKDKGLGEEDEDKRKVITGMSIHSFTKEELQNIAETLGIDKSGKNTELEKRIKKYLVDNNLILL